MERVSLSVREAVMEAAVDPKLTVVVPVFPDKITESVPLPRLRTSVPVPAVTLTVPLLAVKLSVPELKVIASFKVALPPETVSPLLRQTR